VERIRRTLHFIFHHPISKRHILKSFTRFCWWQLQCGISPQKFFVKPFVGQVKFYARKRLTGITGNIYTGLHEFTDMSFLLHFLRSGDIFFDIGANVGSYTLLAAGYCRAKSIAIEPVADTFDILSKNIVLNKLDSLVTLINAGAGANEGTLSFTSGEDTTNHVIAQNESDGRMVTVPVLTVDSLLTDGVPTLIKIDVEGYETEVLKGMTETLDNGQLKAIIIELNGSGMRYGYDEEKIHDLLMSKGFKPYSYDPFNRQLTAMEQKGVLNTIYCRDINFVTGRLSNAGSISVMGEKF
jgi:FkbM family methyltransferase